MKKNLDFDLSDSVKYILSFFDLEKIKYRQNYWERLYAIHFRITVIYMRSLVWNMFTLDFHQWENGNSNRQTQFFKLSVEAADLSMSNFFQTIHNFIFFFYLNSTKQVAIVIREKVKNM